MLDITALPLQYNVKRGTTLIGVIKTDTGKTFSPSTSVIITLEELQQITTFMVGL